MDGPFMSCDNFLVYATRYDDEWKLVLQNVITKDSIIIPQRRWVEFLAVCPGIDRAVDDKFSDYR